MEEHMKNEREEMPEETPLVLVVEDDVEFLSFIISELEESYRIISAAQGREGLRLAREHLPDMVVTDLMMPIMGGAELCQKLKSDPETSHIPVIMLTAKASVESQIEGIGNRCGRLYHQAADHRTASYPDEKPASKRESCCASASTWISGLPAGRVLHRLRIRIF